MSIFDTIEKTFLDEKIKFDQEFVSKCDESLAKISNLIFVLQDLYKASKDDIKLQQNISRKIDRKLKGFNKISYIRDKTLLKISELNKERKK